MFGVAVWKLWFWRNKLVFDNDFVSPKDPVSAILGYVKEVSDAMKLEENMVKKPTKVQQLVGWSFPPQGWVKLNTDGASKTVILILLAPVDSLEMRQAFVMVSLIFCFVTSVIRRGGPPHHSPFP